MTALSVLALFASPRREQARSTALGRIALRALREEAPGARVEEVFLIDHPIRPCMGYYSEDPASCNPRQCTTGVLDDAMKSLHQKVLFADILLFATPVFWYGLPGHLKTFLDRLTSLENTGKLLDGKLAGVVVSAREGGAIPVIQHLFLVLNDMGIWVPPYGFSYVVERSIEEDLWARRYAEQLGRNLVRAWRILRDTGPWWRYGEAVE